MMGRRDMATGLLRRMEGEMAEDTPREEKGVSPKESLTDKLARVLAFNAEQLAEFNKRQSEWGESLQGFEQELKRSESVSEDDLAIRINVRDFD
jgi:hypothetical protein